MKKVLFYYPHINSIGGVEMAMLRLAAKLHTDFDIYIGFTNEDSDLSLLTRMSEFATVINLNHFPNVKFDTVVYCSLYCRKNIKANKYIRWVHGCVTDMKYKMKPEPDLHAVVAVGQTCASQINDQTGQNPVVIYNELDSDIMSKSLDPVTIDRKPLTLTTVSRISPEKGFERMLEVSKELSKANIDYIWHVVGNGYNKAYQDKIIKAAPKQWIFHGSKDNPFPYMKQADFLIQLSDYEAFGYVILESLVLGTPVFTTDYTSASEMVKHGDNGYIVKKDLSDFSVDIFNKKPIFTFDYKSGAKQWLEILQ